ncbi:MAG: ribonuclease P protein component [Proteobacteria bacterium]|nr:ribonuclease P protein component [Pseudomonadota bacterium]
MKETFLKENRLRKRPEFVSLSKTGNKYHNSHFLAVVEKSRFERTRIGITVSKKVGCAVVRNKVKRLVREHFRKNRHKIKGNLDINIIAKKRTAGDDNRIIDKALRDIFYRIER